MHRPLNLFLAAAALLVVVPPPAAFAGASGYGWSDGVGVGADAETQKSVEAPPVRSSGGSRPRCTYDLMGTSEVDIAEHMAKNGMGPSRGDGPGTWYWKNCIDDNGMASATVTWIPQRTDPETVARRALRYTSLPDPAIGMSPPPERGAVVNVPQWLWVNSQAWNPTVATATIDGVTVTTMARPDRVVWNLGNGDEVICDGPGTPYDPARPEADQHSDCTYLFRQAGTFTITATLEWHVTWTAVGMASGGDLGVVRRSASTTVAVSEIQALNRAPA
jgi:hypothetical protein